MRSTAAFIVFDDMTALDFIGVYDPLTRLRSMHVMPDFEWRICGVSAHIHDDRGLKLVTDEIMPPLGGFDLLVVPGGRGTTPLCEDAAFIEWLRSAEPVPLKVSVCTGSLLLAAAGLLEGKAATTHPAAYDELAGYGVDVRRERVVDEGNVITARGVSSGIDLGLYLVEKIAGPAARKRIATQMDYPYDWRRQP